MQEHPFISRVSHAIAIAGKCAGVFALVLLAFLFVTLLMVRGDGTAPAVTHFSVAVLAYTVEFLGVPSEGALFSVVVFWSLASFAVGFVFSLVLSRTESISTDQAAWPWSLGILVIVLGAASFLIGIHEPRVVPVDERALAVEFVANNAEVMRAAGGNGDVDLVGYSQTQGEPATYELAVYGAKTLYAFVEVLQSAPAPKFRLLCTTPLAYGQRDPSKHPCEQR
jgi:hypothetical protein